MTQGDEGLNKIGGLTSPRAPAKSSRLTALASAVEPLRIPSIKNNMFETGTGNYPDRFTLGISCKLSEPAHELSEPVLRNPLQLPSATQLHHEIATQARVQNCSKLYSP